MPNGSQSNTDGSQVANIGWWPKGLVQKVLGQVDRIAGTIRALVAGTQFAAMVDFSEESGSDKVADAVMAEIARRLIVTFVTADAGKVVFAPTAPADHTKIWWQTDPQTGLPIGDAKRWDDVSESWISASSEVAPYVPPTRRRIKQRVAAGASSVNIAFQSIGSVDYYVWMTWTTQNEDLTWATPPVSYPATFGYLVTNKTDTQLTVSFYGVPVGGLMIDGCVEAIPALP